MEEKKSDTNFIKEVAEKVSLLKEELRIADTEILIQKTKLDILATDDIGRINIIEISQTEDEALIFKALDHYDWILHHMETLKKKYQSFNIDYTLAPEIILVSKSFSPDFQRRISYLNRAKIHLYQYSYKDENFEGLKFESVKFKSNKAPVDQTDYKTPEQIINTIKINEVKEKCKKCLLYIRQFKEDISIDTSKSIIQFNDSKGYFAAIYPFDNFFWINFNPDYWSGEKIDKDTELNFNKFID